MAKIRSAGGEAGSRELGRNRDVIGLSAELDPDLLDDGEVLRKANIGEVRAVDSLVRRAPGRVAEGERRGGGDRTGVELLRRSPLGDLGVQDREAAGSERVRGFQLLSAYLRPLPTGTSQKTVPEKLWGTSRTLLRYFK